MTVKELIEFLKTCNQEAEIVDFEGDKITSEQIYETDLGDKNKRKVVCISTCSW